MSKEKSIFHDYDEGKIFRWMAAIEPEISFRLVCNSGIRWGRKNEFFKWIRWHHESDRIFEIDNMHMLSKERIKEINNLITDEYSCRFPIGESEYISWWIHFHVFLNSTDKSYARNIFGKIQLSDMYHNFINSLLFMKKDKHWDWLYSRFANYTAICNDKKLLQENGRTYWISYKTDFLTWLEYRLNNVYDFRLYWYYVA